jgi:hypothetical protein
MPRGRIAILDYDNSDCETCRHFHESLGECELEDENYSIPHFILDLGNESVYCDDYESTDLDDEELS